MVTQSSHLGEVSLAHQVRRDGRQGRISHRPVVVTVVIAKEEELVVKDGTAQRH